MKLRVVQEGYLEACKGAECAVSCCVCGFSEPMQDFLLSPFAEMRQKFEKLGVRFNQREGIMAISGCSDGVSCKVLQHGDGIDHRSLLCKIFPYKLIRVSGGGLPLNTFGIYLSPHCPAAIPRSQVSQKFTDEVTNLIQNFYMQHHGIHINLIIVDAPQEC